LVTGALYYNSTSGVMRVYDGASWIDSGSGLTFAELSSTPTTLAGYGITDAATAAQGTLADSALQSNSTLNADNMTTGTLNGGTYGA
jgi:hypothetical protein